VEVVLRAIYTASFTFHGIDSGVISLVAFIFCTIPRYLGISGFLRFIRRPVFLKIATLLRLLEIANLNH
jgi:hypothetical protein